MPKYGNNGWRIWFASLSNVCVLGYWAPAADDLEPYIEVDLSAEVAVATIRTQGGGVTRPRYVTSYKLFYSLHGTAWRAVRDASGSERVFVGNGDVDSLVVNELQPAESARYFRLVPLAYSDNGIGLRWGLFTC